MLLRARQYEFAFPRPAMVMGIVNVTPDSFSDGGDFLDPERAIVHGRELADEGADILDVGGESTRPGAGAVDAGEELLRVQPVIEGLAAGETPISIDTSKAFVAEAALNGGATMVNDVTALRSDPDLAAVCAETGCEVVLMHMLGDPRTMQENPTYEDVVDDVRSFLAERNSSAMRETSSGASAATPASATRRICRPGLRSPAGRSRVTCNTSAVSDGKPGRRPTCSMPSCAPIRRTRSGPATG